MLELVVFDIFKIFVFVARDAEAGSGLFSLEADARNAYHFHVIQ